MENDIILIIDASTRDLSMYTAAVTQLSDCRLVLRKAAWVGHLCDVTYLAPEMPIMVIGSYQAQSSAGFTDTIVGSLQSNTIIAGGAGFGGFWTDSGVVRGDSLRPFHVKTILIPPGEIIRPIRTGDDNSNPQTAAAAMAGLSLMADVTGSIVVAEGQSDYVRAWQITTPHDSTSKWNYHIRAPPEHREDIFEEKKEVVPVVTPVIEPDTTSSTDPDTRIKDGCTEHKHEGYDGWHPVLRVHKEEVA